jgi:hypothetical protein
MVSISAPCTPPFLHVPFDIFLSTGIWSHLIPNGLKYTKCAEPSKYPQSSSTLWDYSKCGVYTVESEAGC